MPQLGGNKKKEIEKAYKEKEGQVVSAYSEDGQRRIKEDQKKNRIAAAVAILILLAVMTAAVIIMRTVG